MIDPSAQAQLKQAIADCIESDRGVLDALRAEIRPLRSQTRRIQPRATTSISLVATDGGNNQLQFDPFLVQLVRVVDSSNNEYCLEAVSPTTPVDLLRRRQFDSSGLPVTALGEMMAVLGVKTLPGLSHMIRPPKNRAQPVSPAWVQAYRELVEWAILLSILKKDFGTDTLIVCDGLLRSKIFARDLFPHLLSEMRNRIELQWTRSRRRVYLAGVAKRSKVLTRYRLAMALEGVLQTDYPAYVEVPREIEEKAYIWPEYARGEELVAEGGAVNQFVGGKMFLVKFGNSRRDPIWPVDIFTAQRDDAAVILGSMLADAANGFPVPYYPRCLQKAHENAALVDFDFDVIQDHIFDGVRSAIGGQSDALDVFRLQDADPRPTAIPIGETDVADFNLFAREQVVGVFRGFQQEGGLEFHADLVLPYRSEFQRMPMHGQFVLVQLETPDEAVLGRIASLSSEGKLSFGSGEEFNIRAVREERPIPEDLREQYLKYRINIRVLGVLRRSGSGLAFVPSHRRLPHVGSPVAFPSSQVLREIAGHNIEGAAIGHLAFGEYIYAPGGNNGGVEDWMQILQPEVQVRFPIDSLVSRRSFVFARAGFGKSNLNKLLFSTLYRGTPTVAKRRGKRVPVGTVIFDPDGEYFWPDDKGRPGLCDVPELEEKLVVFTPRDSPSPFYQSFVAGGIRLDIRRLRPADVIAIALGIERQEQQNVRKLRALSQERWEGLVNLIDAGGNSTPLIDICRILDLDQDKQEAEAVAARSNMTAIVRMLHDRSSQLMDMLIHSLSEGKLCVIDVSQMRGAQSLVLSGLILRRIFDRNQQEFTSAEPKTIPTIAVVEEAQSVLNDTAPSSEPYIAWVKEGRKYDLGAVLITQQPGSIPPEILSQGDNWFVFHLLSATDLASLKKANAHFSDDLLSSLLNEPIPGQGIFWSSVAGKPYPVSLRVLSFEREYAMRDPGYRMPPGNTYSRRLSAIFANTADPEQTVLIPEGNQESMEEAPGASGIDVLETVSAAAIEALRGDSQIMGRLNGPDGAPWGGIKASLLAHLPEHLDDRANIAYRLVKTAMDRIFGPQGTAWESYKRPPRGTTYVRKILLP